MALFILGIVLSALIGAAVSRYYASRRRLKYLIKERKVLDPVRGRFPHEVEVRFSGEPVYRLSEWKIFLWNSGNQTINRNDVVQGLLRLQFEGMSLLGTPSATSSRESVAPDAQIINNSNIMEISFDYLDRYDCVGITIYTQPLQDWEGPILVNLQGYIRGIPGGPKRLDAKEFFSNRREAWTTSIMAVPMFGMTALFGYAFIAQGNRIGLWNLLAAEQERPVTTGSWVGLGFVALMMVMSALGATIWIILMFRQYGNTPKFVRENLF